MIKFTRARDTNLVALSCAASVRHGDYGIFSASNPYRMGRISMPELVRIRSLLCRNYFITKQ